MSINHVSYRIYGSTLRRRRVYRLTASEIFYPLSDHGPQLNGFKSAKLAEPFTPPAISSQARPDAVRTQMGGELRRSQNERRRWFLEHVSSGSCGPDVPCHAIQIRASDLLAWHPDPYPPASSVSATRTCYHERIAQYQRSERS